MRGPATAVSDTLPDADTRPLGFDIPIDPSIITKEVLLYMDISLDRGASYGDTLVWPAGSQPGLGEQQVHVLEEVNTQELNKLFMELLLRQPDLHQ